MSTKKVKTVTELAYNPEPKPENKAEQWWVFNKMWEDQIRGKGIKVHEQHASAKLKACMVGGPFAIYVPDPNAPEMKGLTKDNMDPEALKWWDTYKYQSVKDADPEYFAKFVEETMSPIQPVIRTSASASSNARLDQDELTTLVNPCAVSQLALD